jgi:hypothetical protein
MEEDHRSPEQLDSKQKRKYWEAHFHAWEESGLTQIEYRRQNNLKSHLWWYWRKRISQTIDNDVKFVPLSFTSDKIPGSPIRVFTPNGYQIEIDKGFDFSKLRQLVEAVKGL